MKQCSHNDIFMYIQNHLIFKNYLMKYVNKEKYFVCNLLNRLLYPFMKFSCALSIKIIIW